MNKINLNKNLKSKVAISLLAVLICSAPLASFAVTDNVAAHGPFFLTMNNNATANALLVYSSNGQLVSTLPTGGAGGVSGNAGAVQVKDFKVAVVDFNSRDVAMFAESGNSFTLKGRISTTSSPISIAFGGNHLYVLETDRVESFKIQGFLNDLNTNPILADGSVTETKADGSAAQIGYLSDGHVIYTEKSGAVSEIALSSGGAVAGSSALVSNLPASLSIPFGLSTKDKVAVVTSAHDTVNQELLVVNGVVTAVANGTDVFPNDADCWNTFYHQFVFSADSPGKKLDRYRADQNQLVFDGVAAYLPGSPTDLSASDFGFLGVITSGGAYIFNANGQGQIALVGSSSATSLNGAAWSQ